MSARNYSPCNTGAIPLLRPMRLAAIVQGTINDTSITKAERKPIKGEPRFGNSRIKLDCVVCTD
jgi:hypothetical protein